MNTDTPHEINVRMLRSVYAIRDDKQKEFNPPVLMPNDAVAARTFGDHVLSDKNAILFKHAGDFSIWYLGEFDCESGDFVLSDNRHIVARASDFVSVTAE